MSERSPLFLMPHEPGAAPLPAGAAMACVLVTSDGYAPSWMPERAERVCMAIFSVLTEDQQTRVLQALGWQLAPLPPYSTIQPDPARGAARGVGEVPRG